MIVDISDEMRRLGDDQADTTSPTALEVKKGDILIYNTGYHRYFNGAPEEDEERYFLRHPGGDREFAEWLVEMELAWTGFDCGSGDNPLNTSIRTKWRPEIAEPVREADRQGPRRGLPRSTTSSSCTRCRSEQGITHVENLGGDLERPAARALPDRRLPDPDRGRRGLALPRGRLRRGLMPEAAHPMAEASGETGSFDELPSEEAYPGVNRRSFSTHEATVNSYTFEPGASFPLHSHHQEQITLVTEGSVEMTVEGEVSSLDEGCWSVVSGGVEHGITAGPDGAAIVAMIVPRRQGSDDYELAEDDR